ncbi:MAG: dephospho-CoA kinase [Clostridiales bacterium]|nr:dephospho-CoA kinase [Clostridiales bacterium]
MFVLGVTGGIGTGKSTVSGYFRDKGVEVLDADEISRQVTDVGGVALPEIAELLGMRAISSNGALNRKYVASLVFSEKKKLDKLSAIIHRYVLSTIAEEIAKAAERKVKLIVLDVPIPVRHGFVDVCNQILVVSSSDEIRLDRLVLRGMDRDDARKRMAMQMTREEYEELADRVLVNDGTIEELYEQIDKYVKEELNERGIRL